MVSGVTPLHCPRPFLASSSSLSSFNYPNFCKSLLCSFTCITLLSINNGISSSWSLLHCWRQARVRVYPSFRHSEAPLLTNDRNSGEPSGSKTKISNSIEAYIAEPSGKTVHKETAILILPDVIGIWQNSQLIADQFAANGYYALLVDLFNGDPMSLNSSPDFDFMKWLTSGSTGDNPHTLKEVDPIVEKSISYLKEKGYKKIGAVGYCFVGFSAVVRIRPLIKSRALNTLSAS